MIGSETLGREIDPHIDVAAGRDLDGVRDQGLEALLLLLGVDLHGVRQPVAKLRMERWRCGFSNKPETAISGIVDGHEGHVRHLYRNLASLNLREVEEAAAGRVNAT